jgi:endonuclease III
MARETPDQKRTRVRTLIKKLHKHYPGAECALIHKNPFELLLATILSAQCTDEKVNEVTRDLFEKYKTAKDFAEADIGDLEMMVRPTGFYKNKAKSLQGAAQKILAEHGGEVPQSLEQLIELPGVGRKTANVVMGVAFKIPTGIVVDTHVGRLSYRLGLTPSEAPVQIEKDLQVLVPESDWIAFSHLLIMHGRAICKARKPDCPKCFLNSDCPKRGVKLTKPKP